MILWFGITIIAVAALSGITAMIVFARKQTPNDFTILPAALTAILLLAQIVIMIIAPFSGNPAVGDPLEIWLYMIVAFALPIAVGIWALVDKTKWANLVLSVMQFAVAVMTWRMLDLWLGLN